MSSRAIILDEFLTASRDGYVCLDARSPAEFAHAHVHGAVNLPLLNDEERHEVGLSYKNEGKDAAAKKGFSLVGHKFVDYIRQAESHSPQKRLAIYCWRGGLRSHVMAWVMSTAGFDVVILKGGYKTWRQRVLEILDTEFHMTVLSGKTGCGKTECLQRLREIGEPVIDLEGLAHHRGSTYGALGMPQQPSQEMFENELARHILMTGNSFWVEDESRWIGKVKIPDRFFDTLRKSAIIELEAGAEYRKKRILDEYGIFPPDQLIERTSLLSRRLGGDRLNAAVSAITEGRLGDWVDIMFDYYDRTYAYGLDMRRDNPRSGFDIEHDTQGISGLVALRSKN